MGTPILRYKVELTDTFGGEANYTWVMRANVNINANYSGPWIVRQAKSALGLTGMKGKTTDFGDSIRVDFPSDCMVLFINLAS